jgi:hypothetical protein
MSGTDLPDVSPPHAHQVPCLDTRNDNLERILLMGVDRPHIPSSCNRFLPPVLILGAAEARRAQILVILVLVLVIPVIAGKGVLDKLGTNNRERKDAVFLIRIGGVIPVVRHEVDDRTVAQGHSGRSQDVSYPIGRDSRPCLLVTLTFLLHRQTNTTPTPPRFKNSLPPIRKV